LIAAGSARLLMSQKFFKQELDRNWARVEEAHERSGVGNWCGYGSVSFSAVWAEKNVSSSPRDFEYLGIAGSELPERHSSRSRQRVSTARARDDRRVQKLVGTGTQSSSRLQNTGRSSGLADMLRSTTPPTPRKPHSRGELCDETSYFSGEVLTATLLKAYLPDGFVLPEGIWPSSGRVICLTSQTCRVATAKTKVESSAFFPTSAICSGGLRRAREHGIGQ